MNKNHLFWILPLCLVIAIFVANTVDVYLMEDYRLYNCIYSNADDNGFSKNPYIIQKVQEECICFFEHNFTNVFEYC